MANRKAQIAQNIRAGHAPVSGGTTAPAGAAKSPTTGIGRNQQAPNPGRLGQAQPASGGGLSAAPQPGAAAPAKPQPLLPWDVAAANSEAGAFKANANTLTGLDAGWQRTQQAYGLEGPYADAASNPYSRSALLQRSYDNAKTGSRNSAGRGIYAGSYVNAQNANTHNFNLGRDELQKSYDQNHGEYISQRQGAENALNEALAQAAWDRVNAGLSAEPEPMPGGGSGGGGAPAKKKQPNRQQQIKRNISPARKAR
jgi:hypothetical protein